MHHCTLIDKLFNHLRPDDILFPRLTEHMNLLTCDSMQHLQKSANQNPKGGKQGETTDGEGHGVYLTLS